MTDALAAIRACLDFMGGVHTAPPPRMARWISNPIVWGIWWAFLMLVVLAFSGQASRFIYIDF